MAKRLKFFSLICIVSLLMTGVVVAENNLEQQLEEVEELSHKIWEIDGDEQPDEKEELLLKRLDLVEEIMADYPDQVEVYWQAAEAYHDLAFYEDETVEVLKDGKGYAEDSIELAPDEAKGYFWRGALKGQIGLEEGIRSSLSTVEPMKEDLEQAIELDPDYAAAYDALAHLYMEVPGWPVSIGDEDKALEYREQSVELEPDNFQYQWGLYENYQEVGADEKAEEVLEDILELPLDEKQSDAEEIKEKAREKKD